MEKANRKTVYTAFVKSRIRNTTLNTAFRKIDDFNPQVKACLEELSDKIDEAEQVDHIIAACKIKGACELLERIGVLTDKESKILAAYYGVR